MLAIHLSLSFVASELENINLPLISVSKRFGSVSGWNANERFWFETLSLEVMIFTSCGFLIVIAIASRSGGS